MFTDKLPTCWPFWVSPCTVYFLTSVLNKLISGLFWQLRNIHFPGFQKWYTNWIFCLISFLRAGTVRVLGLLWRIQPYRSSSALRSSPANLHYPHMQKGEEKIFPFYWWRQCDHEPRIWTFSNYGEELPGEPWKLSLLVTVSIPLPSPVSPALQKWKLRL